MSDEQTQQTILRAVKERTEARKGLATVDRRFAEVADYLTALGKELALLRESRVKHGDDTILRLLRNVPDAVVEIVRPEPIRALLVERDELARRIDDASEYLRAMGIE